MWLLFSMSMLLTVKHFPNSLKISWRWCVLTCNYFFFFVLLIPGCCRKPDRCLDCAYWKYRFEPNREPWCSHLQELNGQIWYCQYFSWESLPSGQMVTAGKMICSMGIWRTDVEVRVSDQSPRTRNAMKNVRIKTSATIRNQKKLRTPPLLLQTR